MSASNSPASGPQTATTIGTLSRRTGVPVKLLREYEDAGLIYTVGRSAGNYRLFGDEALWCVAVVTELRAVGLTMAEICELTRDYLHNLDEPIGPRLTQLLGSVRKRTTTRIDELQQLLKRLDEFESDYADELTGRTDFRQWDPRAPGLDSPPGGNPSVGFMRDQRTTDGPASTVDCCGPALWGWSPPRLPADTPAKQVVDRVLPSTGFPALAYFAAVVVLLNLAPHLPTRGELALDGLAALAGGGWCAANFWRCRHAHCLITGTGWLALSGFAFVEAIMGRSVIGGNEQIVFLAVLAAGIAFEVAWRIARGTNAVTARDPTRR